MNLCARVAIAAGALLPATSLVACTVATDTAVDAEDALVGDARSIVANDDGTFTVTCKDGRVETEVTASEILANKICEPAPALQPPPVPTPWASAKHQYREALGGGVFNVSPDNRFALVNFSPEGFGSLDLRNYTFTSYGSWMEERHITFMARGSKVLIARSVAFPNTPAKGLEFTLRDLTDPTLVRTVKRAPIVGAGHLSINLTELCADGTAQWTEGTEFVTATPTEAELSVQLGTERLECPSSDPPREFRYDDYPPDFFKRTDRVFDGGWVKTCSAGRCTPVRALPHGAQRVVFSRSGDFLTYDAGGLLYRDTLAGMGAPRVLPYMPFDERGVNSYARDERGGKLLTSTGIYDIDADRLAPLPARTVPYFDAPKYLLNDVTAYRVKGSDTLLVNAANEMVIVGGGPLIERRPGLMGNGVWVF